MSAKLLMGLSEENQELEKQIGCMTGIFQVFDRKHLLTGRKHKRIISGRSRSSNTTSKEESVPRSPQIVMEYNPNKSSKQNLRDSVESSPSSPFIPNKFNKEIKPKNLNIETKSMRNDFRDVVKDSINGETRALNIKTSVIKEEVKKEENVLKHRDSPRPIMSVDLSNSLRVLVRLKEAPWNNTEAPPRFSCDGREITRSKSSTKLREIPRLSLDGREASLKSNSKEMDNKGSLSPRIPSVVAKLMGLEPNSVNEGENDHILVKNVSHVTKQSENVYSQIERRVNELDFSQSNNDLRALKHILDKMQAKGLLDNQQSKPYYQENQNLKPPVVIMKPKKSVKNLDELEGLSGLRKLRSSDSVSKKKSKEQAPVTKKIQIPHMERSPRPQMVVRERKECPVRNLSYKSSRIQQRKNEPEKKPRISSPRKQNGAQKVKPNQAQGNVNLAIPLCHQDNQKIQSEDGSAINLVEQPSPISVLDSSFYQDDLPLSPVKKITCGIEDDETNASLVSLVNTTPSKLSSEVNVQKFNSIKNLIEKLRRLGSYDKSDDEELDYGCLSQTLLSQAPYDQNLIFDVIKEILVQKFELMGRKPRANKLNGKRFLAKLCEEIKQIIVEEPLKSAGLEDEELRIHDDLTKQSYGLEIFDIEVPGLVLEIERSIFKDLIDEIVISEARFGMLPKGNRMRRQLFM